VLNLDAWHETLQTLRRHKLRTLLTALSVAWGIFMLVILLAAGRGLERGVEYDFRDDATNSIWVSPGKTSVAYKGQPPGRAVRFENDDVDAIARQIAGVERITGRFYLWGEFSVSYGMKTAQFDIRGCHPGHLYLERTRILEGRFINDFDVKSRRKVAVIGPEVRAQLFGARDPLGEYITIRGVKYKVIGLYEDDGAQNELRKIYIPITTAQLVYSAPRQVHHIMYTVGDADLEQSERMAAATRELLARRHRFSPEDKRALRVNNNLEQFSKVQEIFAWISVFVWVVGVGTIFAGVVGVGNVMLISVKERTVEFGVRKALGATPWSIVKMVLQEALLVTSLAGYAGLCAGALVVEAVNRYVPENDYFREPQVDFRAALWAVGILVLAGALAGVIPAFRAARVHPVVAMRGE
jgi:putative ABC transport system permease protein